MENDRTIYRDADVRMYSKKELALMYYPNLKLSSALARLRRDLTRIKLLSQQLDDVGYIKYQRFFSAQQVQCIFDMYGEP